MVALWQVSLPGALSQTCCVFPCGTQVVGCDFRRVRPRDDMPRADRAATTFSVILPRIGVSLMGRPPYQPPGRALAGAIFPKLVKALL